jgi:hypothetical protein
MSNVTLHSEDGKKCEETSSSATVEDSEDMPRVFRLPYFTLCYHITHLSPVSDHTATVIP